MAYFGTKGWYIKELKALGMTKHPIERRKLELYKTYVVRNFYIEAVAEKKQFQM
ncbi:YflJ family protein [Metabacillus fastidiosus]|uniref:YflJ family protein n=1 Tax=Metabacillus fastidiosus TaxID=1458 RepID=A0ABU6NZU3_9BACI|nr:YflJ family protein [Metabacillus fastidiosus]MED4402615.1 YflJ family protein [Metabacillus fastidiosus]MED4461975.1 YflJ family protein [Metabacillus fastidiosus]